MSLDSDDPEPRPWILLVLAAVLVLIGLDHLDNLDDPDQRELAVGGFGFAALFVAFFFLPDLREFVSRYWPPRL
ncbi:MAG: hypothetical protein H6Q10_2031 [Acidobacteria bacterium]|nr:hypothetical protein [Acidobacteriota bacterium]